MEGVFLIEIIRYGVYVSISFHFSSHHLHTIGPFIEILIPDDSKSSSVHAYSESVSQ